MGPRVVELLRHSGYRVRAFSRRPVKGLLAPGVDLQCGDIADPAAVDTAMAGVSLVIHLAALLHVVDDAPQLHQEFDRVNCIGTQHVVDAAVRHGVERVVHFSTISVYGTGDGSVFHEDSPVNPVSAYAKTKLAGERIVLNAVRQDGRPLGTVLRLAAVYGSRVKGNYDQLLRALARGWFVPVGEGRNRRSLVYDRDVARAALVAATHPAAAGRLYNVSDAQPHELREIIATICHALGRKPPRIVMPVGLARAAAAVAEDGAQMFGLKSQFRRSTIDKYLEDIAVDNTRIRAELRFEPTYDLTAGWAEAVREVISTSKNDPFAAEGESEGHLEPGSTRCLPSSGSR